MAQSLMNGGRVGEALAPDDLVRTARYDCTATLEELGFYEPTKPASASRIDIDRIEEWVSKGAQLSPTVKRLVKQHSRPEAAAAPTA